MSVCPFTVVDATGDRIAVCAHVEDAALIVAATGDGARIRFNAVSGKVLWDEGKEAQPAGESVDFVAITALGRLGVATAPEAQP